MKGLNTSKGGVENVTVPQPNLTASVKLIVKDEDQQKLLRLHDLYRCACNWLVDDVVTTRVINRVQLHHYSYYRLREQFPELGAQMACNVIRSVSAAYKTLLSNHSKFRNKEIELKRIVFKNPSVHLDKNTLTYLDANEASMYTLDGRIRVQLNTIKQSCLH